MVSSAEILFKNSTIQDRPTQINISKINASETCLTEIRASVGITSMRATALRPMKQTLNLGESLKQSAAVLGMIKAKCLEA